MNFNAIILIVALLSMREGAFSLIWPRRQFDCDTRSNEYFTYCRVPECEATCDNPEGSCSNNFHPVVDDCRLGCVCSPGYVRDHDGKCGLISFVCRYRELDESFSKQMFRDEDDDRAKSRRRELRYSLVK